MKSYAMTEEERNRQAARTKVAQAANRGELPSALWNRADLEWAFEGDEESLARYEEIAQQKRAEQREKEQERDRRLAVSNLASVLLKQWDEDEKRERKARAWAEATRILAEQEAAAK